MPSKVFSTALIACLAIGGSAAAHHNPNVLYDLTQSVTVTGVVTRFSPGNPHVRIYFTRTDGVGPEGQEWMAEGGSRTVLLRRDWTADLVKPGDPITVEGHPARDAANVVVHMERVTLPDGRTLWAEDLPPAQKLQELIQRRPAGQPAPQR